MISSIPNFFCCITKPFRNKIVLKNESDFKVQYEVYIYSGGSMDMVVKSLYVTSFANITMITLKNCETLVFLM